MELLIASRADLKVRAGRSHSRPWFSVHGQRNPIGIGVCLYNEQEKFEVLRAAGYDFKQGNEYGLNPAWAAVYGCHTEIVRQLYEMGCDIIGSDIKKEVGCHEPCNTYAAGNFVYFRNESKGWNLNFLAVWNSAPLELLRLQLDAGVGLYTGVTEQAPFLVEYSFYNLGMRDSDMAEAEDTSKVDLWYENGYDVNSNENLHSVFKRMGLTHFAFACPFVTRGPAFVRMMLDRRADLNHKVAFFGTALKYAQTSSAFCETYNDWIMMKEQEEAVVITKEPGLGEGLLPCLLAGNVLAGNLPEDKKAGYGGDRV
jgi:hypothetical protein